MPPQPNPEPTIRRATDADHDAFYTVCLQTGAAGADASDHFDDPLLLGSVYVGPYLHVDGGFGWAVEDSGGVGGYLLATADTAAFGDACETTWWPPLRAVHGDPGPAPTTPDAELRALIHRPPAVPVAIVERYPAHLHIDLLPRFQSRGVGRRLIELAVDELGRRGATGVHLGADPTNSPALGFYHHLGFDDLGVVDDTHYCGLSIQSSRT